MQLGIDPTRVGSLTKVNMEVGLCHPPGKLNLYVASSIAKMGMTEFTICRVAVAHDDAALPGGRDYLPQISVWLPKPIGMLPKPIGMM